MYSRNGQNILSPRHSPQAGETGKYQKMRPTKEFYLAFVVAIRDPLNIDLDIYWPDYVAENYRSALNYNYEFISEELGSEVQTRKVWSCHLRGVEINLDQNDLSFMNMKEAYIFVSSQINKNNGWILISVSDIDIYKRVLVNIFDLVSRVSINQRLLSLTSRSGTQIAREYNRPNKPKTSFNPQLTNCYMTYNTEADIDG